MRWHTALIVLPIVAVSAGCSPYLYKGEIDEFSKGVNQLAEANTLAVQGAKEAVANRYRWIWLNDRPKLALKMDGACPLHGIKEGGLRPCGLREKPISQSVPKASEPIREEQSEGADQTNQEPREWTPSIQDGGAKRIMKALQDYADALAAVTNAADREALKTAQERLNQSVNRLSSASGLSSGRSAAAGPVIGLFNTLTGAWLDTRRYQVLRANVLEANGPVGKQLGPVGKLGQAMGELLTSLRRTQLNALWDTATELNRKLEHGDEGSTYETRLDALQSTFKALEAVRSTDPEKAANDMIEAHDKLADALEQNQGQFDAVITSTNEFFDSAKAVREAFAAGVNAQQGSQ